MDKCFVGVQNVGWGGGVDAMSPFSWGPPNFLTQCSGSGPMWIRNSGFLKQRDHFDFREKAWFYEPKIFECAGAE
jgi:hypothetical protein